MLKDITTINLQGANFDSLTSFSIFEPSDGKDKQGNVVFKTIKGALLYGRNGTGKSTIARAFRKAKGEMLPTIKKVSFTDKDENLIMLSEDEKKRIFVFDEDFVNDNVKLKEDHLETIIMLGQAVDLAVKIEKAERELEVSKAVLETKDVAFKEYKDTSNPKSPKNRLWKIGNALRGDDAWAGRDAKIRVGARQNTQVRDDTYKQFLPLIPTKKKSELLMEFEEQLKALDVARKGSSKIEIPVPSVQKSYEEYDDETIIGLLSQKIEKPELSDREQYLLKLVEAGEAGELSRKADFFRNPTVKECPYCFQPVSNENRLNLVASIEKVLSKTVKEHQKVLETHVYEDLIIDMDVFKDLQGHNICKELIKKINTSIHAQNDLIRQKIENPYKSIEAKSLDIATLVKQLIEALSSLENERVEFNKRVTDAMPIINRLNEINSHIAHYDIVDLATEYEKQLADYKAAEINFNEAKEDYDAKKKVVEELEAQRKNVQLALDIINACLKYIFFAEDRLSIDFVDDEYRLYSHGKSVRPCDVSVGERNIIGLSYFFTSIMEGQEEKDAYGKEYLLVIDDPVSSYDTENRIGILSFLKYKLGTFLEENEYSKALILTHDLMTFYDIHKILEEIVKCCKRNGYTLEPKFNRFEMSNGKLLQFANKRQEYTEILKIMFSYAQGDNNGYDLVIGNLMRQGLEAFATFQYKKGIEEISTDPDILDLLPEPEFRTYYENLMYRLVLHGSSHKEEQIKAMKDYEFFSLITEQEKKRTAKEVLCFIYLLNKHHVLQHLQGIRNAETILNDWCNEVKKRATK